MEVSNKILRLPAVKAATGLSRSTIYKFIKEGSFPKPIALGGHLSGWIESEIQSWISERINHRSERLSGNASR